MSLFSELLIEVHKGTKFTHPKHPGQFLAARLLAVDHIMFTPARDFLLETPWRIIIPIPNVNSHSL
jgi:hypothetical protein